MLYMKLFWEIFRAGDFTSSKSALQQDLTHLYLFMHVIHLKLNMMKNEEEVGFVLHPQQPIPTISHSIMACHSPHEFPHQLHRSEHMSPKADNYFWQMLLLSCSLGIQIHELPFTQRTISKPAGCSWSLKVSLEQIIPESIKEKNWKLEAILVSARLTCTCVSKKMFLLRTPLLLF